VGRASPTRRGENLPVAVVLRRLARDLTATPAQAWLRGWLHRDGRSCVGVGLIFEAWLGPVRPGYRHGDLSKAPAALRREVRVAAAVDTDLGLHRVTRPRGEEPTIRTWPELPAWSRKRRIVTGLRSLTELARVQ
jgi:hypothetical protein